MNILAIYVLYRPDLEILRLSIENVQNSVNKIFISDNSEQEKINIDWGPNIEYHFNNGNLGIAAAQNKGIDYAIRNKYDQIIFLDQDSSFPSGFFYHLIEEYKLLQENDRNFIAIGPTAVNKGSGVTLNKKSFIKNFQFKNKEYILARELMNSASLWDISVFKKIGGMEVGLFIDDVDYEISWRARKKLKGNLYISKNIVMYHNLGEGDYKILNKTFHRTTPFRFYYQIRNYLILIRRSYVPFSWKITEGMKCLIRLILLHSLSNKEVKTLHLLRKAIKDSIFYK